MSAGAYFVRYMRVHSGPWSALGSRWPQATDREIQRGDLVILDAIGAVEGYQFDVNRSLPAGPTMPTVCSSWRRPPGRSRRRSTRAGPAIESPMWSMRPRAVIDRSPFANAFGGMMGHGIGLETVEEPLLTAGDETELEAGMVLCVEPGLFVPNWGGALIEQEVIVRDAARQR